MLVTYGPAVVQPVKRAKPQETIMLFDIFIKFLLVVVEDGSFYKGATLNASNIRLVILGY